MADDRPPSISVLLDALERIHKYVDAEDAEGQGRLQETEQWFASREASDPQSFEHICADLRLDPERIRGAVARRRARVVG